MHDAKIILASASPRRQELLRQIGVAFEVMPSEVAELVGDGESAADYVLRVSTDKARYATRRVSAMRHNSIPVLGADTEVVIDQSILGKPRDREHGCEMLRRLAGRTHDVVTGICVIHQGKEYRSLSENRVTFGPMSENDIARYWDSGEPLDKAGAYAIQGLAAGYIVRLEGSYSSVMGLPLYELALILRQLGMRIP